MKRLEKVKSETKEFLITEPEELKIDKRLILYNKQDLFSFMRPDPPIGIAPRTRKDEKFIPKQREESPIDTPMSPVREPEEEMPQQI